MSFQERVKILSQDHTAQVACEFCSANENDGCCSNESKDPVTSNSPESLRMIENTKEIYCSTNTSEVPDDKEYLRTFIGEQLTSAFVPTGIFQVPQDESFSCKPSLDQNANLLLQCYQWFDQFIPPGPMRALFYLLESERTRNHLGSSWMFQFKYNLINQIYPVPHDNTGIGMYASSQRTSPFLETQTTNQPQYQLPPVCNHRCSSIVRLYSDQIPPKTPMLMNRCPVISHPYQSNSEMSALSSLLTESSDRWDRCTVSRDEISSLHEYDDSYLLGGTLTIKVFEAKTFQSGQNNAIYMTSCQKANFLIHHVLEENKHLYLPNTHSLGEYFQTPKTHSNYLFPNVNVSSELRVDVDLGSYTEAQTPTEQVTESNAVPFEVLTKFYHQLQSEIEYITELKHYSDEPKELSYFPVSKKLFEFQQQSQSESKEEDIEESSSNSFPIHLQDSSHTSRSRPPLGSSKCTSIQFIHGSTEGSTFENPQIFPRKAEYKSLQVPPKSVSSKKGLLPESLETAIAKSLKESIRGVTSKGNQTCEFPHMTEAKSLEGSSKGLTFRVDQTCESPKEVMAKSPVESPKGAQSEGPQTLPKNARPTSLQGLPKSAMSKCFRNALRALKKPKSNPSPSSNTNQKPPMNIPKQLDPESSHCSSMTDSHNMQQDFSSCTLKTDTPKLQENCYRPPCQMVNWSSHPPLQKYNKKENISQESNSERTHTPPTPIIFSEHTFEKVTNSSKPERPRIYDVKSPEPYQMFYTVKFNKVPPVYEPSEHVSGFLAIGVKENIACCGVRARLRGTVRVSVEETEEYLMTYDDSEKAIKHDNYEDSQPSFNFEGSQASVDLDFLIIEVNIEEKKSIFENNMIPRGFKELPFSFKLPDSNLANHYTDQNMIVEYRLELMLVTCPNNLTDDASLWHRQCETPWLLLSKIYMQGNQMIESCCSYKPAKFENALGIQDQIEMELRSKVKVRGKLSRTVFAIGDIIHLTVSTSNLNDSWLNDPVPVSATITPVLLQTAIIANRSLVKLHRVVDCELVEAKQCILGASEEKTYKFRLVIGDILPSTVISAATPGLGEFKILYHLRVLFTLPGLDHPFVVLSQALSIIDDSQLHRSKCGAQCKKHFVPAHTEVQLVDVDLTKRGQDRPIRNEGLSPLEKLVKQIQTSESCNRSCDRDKRKALGMIEDSLLYTLFFITEMSFDAATVKPLSRKEELERRKADRKIAKKTAKVISFADSSDPNFQILKNVVDETKLAVVTREQRRILRKHLKNSMVRHLHHRHWLRESLYSAKENRAVSKEAMRTWIVNTYEHPIFGTLMAFEDLERKGSVSHFSIGHRQGEYVFHLSAVDVRKGEDFADCLKRWETRERLSFGGNFESTLMNGLAIVCAERIPNVSVSHYVGRNSNAAELEETGEEIKNTCIEVIADLQKDYDNVTPKKVPYALDFFAKLGVYEDPNVAKHLPRKNLHRVNELSESKWYSKFKEPLHDIRICAFELLNELVSEIDVFTEKFPEYRFRGYSSDTSMGSKSYGNPSIQEATVSVEISGNEVLNTLSRKSNKAKRKQGRNQERSACGVILSEEYSHAESAHGVEAILHDIENEDDDNNDDDDDAENDQRGHKGERESSSCKTPRQLEGNSCELLAKTGLERENSCGDENSNYLFDENHIETAPVAVEMKKEIMNTEKGTESLQTKIQWVPTANDKKNSLSVIEDTENHFDSNDLICTNIETIDSKSTVYFERCSNQNELEICSQKNSDTVNTLSTDSNSSLEQVFSESELLSDEKNKNHIQKSYNSPMCPEKCQGVDKNVAGTLDSCLEQHRSENTACELPINALFREYIMDLENGSSETLEMIDRQSKMKRMECTADEMNSVILSNNSSCFEKKSLETKEIRNECCESKKKEGDGVELLIEKAECHKIEESLKYTDLTVHSDMTLNAQETVTTKRACVHDSTNSSKHSEVSSSAVTSVFEGSSDACSTREESLDKQFLLTVTENSDKAKCKRLIDQVGDIFPANIKVKSNNNFLEESNECKLLENTNTDNILEDTRAEIARTHIEHDSKITENIRASETIKNNTASLKDSFGLDTKRVESQQIQQKQNLKIDESISGKGKRRKIVAHIFQNTTAKSMPGSNNLLSTKRPNTTENSAATESLSDSYDISHGKTSTCKVSLSAPIPESLSEEPACNFLNIPSRMVHDFNLKIAFEGKSDDGFLYKRGLNIKSQDKPRNQDISNPSTEYENIMVANNQRIRSTDIDLEKPDIEPKVSGCADASPDLNFTNNDCQMFSSKVHQTAGLSKADCLVANDKIALYCTTDGIKTDTDCSDKNMLKVESYKTKNSKTLELETKNHIVVIENEESSQSCGKITEDKIIPQSQEKMLGIYVLDDTSRDMNNALIVDQSELPDLVQTANGEPTLNALKNCSYLGQDEKLNQLTQFTEPNLHEVSVDSLEHITSTNTGFQVTFQKLCDLVLAKDDTACDKVADSPAESILQQDVDSRTIKVPGVYFLENIESQILNEESFIEMNKITSNENTYPSNSGNPCNSLERTLKQKADKFETSQQGRPAEILTDDSSTTFSYPKTEDTKESKMDSIQFKNSKQHTIEQMERNSSETDISFTCLKPSQGIDSTSSNMCSKTLPQISPEISLSQNILPWLHSFYDPKAAAKEYFERELETYPTTFREEDSVSNRQDYVLFPHEPQPSYSHLNNMDKTSSNLFFQDQPDDYTQYWQCGAPSELSYFKCGESTNIENIRLRNEHGTYPSHGTSYDHYHQIGMYSLLDGSDCVGHHLEDGCTGLIQFEKPNSYSKQNDFDIYNRENTITKSNNRNGAQYPTFRPAQTMGYIPSHPKQKDLKEVSEMQDFSKDTEKHLVSIGPFPWQSNNLSGSFSGECLKRETNDLCPTASSELNTPTTWFSHLLGYREQQLDEELQRDYSRDTQSLETQAFHNVPQERTEPEQSQVWPERRSRTRKRYRGLKNKTGEALVMDKLLLELHQQTLKLPRHQVGPTKDLPTQQEELLQQQPQQKPPDQHQLLRDQRQCNAPSMAIPVQPIQVRNAGNFLSTVARSLQFQVPGLLRFPSIPPLPHRNQQHRFFQPQISAGRHRNIPKY